MRRKARALAQFFLSSLTSVEVGVEDIIALRLGFGFALGAASA